MKTIVFVAPGSDLAASGGAIEAEGFAAPNGGRNA
jgi:hypothetical protein